VNPHDVMYFDTDPDGGTQRSEIFPIFPAPDAEPYTDELAVELPASFDDDLSDQPEGVQAYAHLCDVTYGEVRRDRTDLWLRHVNYYVNCIRDLDRHLGTVLDALEASGQAENTIVVYTSDHGELAGAHGLRQKGGVVYRETVNVPFIVAHPDGPKGVETDAVGSHLDIAPTMLAMAGLGEQERRERYPDLHGEDLSDVIDRPEGDGPRGSPSAPGKGVLYTYDMLSSIDIDWLARVAQATLDTGDAELAHADAEDEAEKGRLRNALDTMRGILQPDFSLRHNLRGVFDGRYKLVRYFALDGYNTPQDVGELREKNNLALYDLEADPEERDNLANADRPGYDEELLARLNAKLNELIRTEIGKDKALVKRPMLKILGSTISEKLRTRF
jgi:arylsulfatase A-like enzyme